MMDPNVRELLDYNAGLQWTHQAVSSATGYSTATWHERPTACGRTYPNRRTLVTDNPSIVDCPGCLRARDAAVDRLRGDLVEAMTTELGPRLARAAVFGPEGSMEDLEAYARANPGPVADRPRAFVTQLGNGEVSVKKAAPGGRFLFPDDDD